MTPFSITAADGFEGQYRNKTQFMAALGDRVNLAFLAHGEIRHLAIENVTWTEIDPDGTKRPYPIATVTARQGGNEGLLTVDRLRAAFAAREKDRRTKAGRLI